MLPGLNISLPSLSLSSLSLDTIRQFKREVARIKIVFPTATCRALLDTDLVDCVESTFDVTMDSLSDDQMMAYVLRLVGPIDYNNWVEALNAVECSAETTHANSRLQNVRAVGLPLRILGDASRCPVRHLGVSRLEILSKFQDHYWCTGA